MATGNNPRPRSRGSRVTPSLSHNPCQAFCLSPWPALQGSVGRTQMCSPDVLFAVCTREVLISSFPMLEMAMEGGARRWHRVTSKQSA